MATFPATPVERMPAPSEVATEHGSACGANAWDRLSADESAAWTGFLQAQADIELELANELQATHGLSFSDYFALLALDRAPEGKLRMHDLAKPVRLTRSGLTRLVERLERAGLIERWRCADDARGTEAAITDAGRELLREASATHLAGVRRRFFERFSPAELRLLAEQFGRLTAT
ncbi:MAG TPA: MarR family transcriptional regulator [Conexibacter sp.]|jgi:DNA-binding MarR family transcriptional regulator